MILAALLRSCSPALLLAPRSCPPPPPLPRSPPFPMTIFLLGAAVLNTVYLFTRIKLYRLHLRPDPVSSPNAKFVAAQLDFQLFKPPSSGAGFGLV
ncbi:hypothetical protein B0H14DRAFT_3451145 [Mycena olivaceomarginata]|nr:hypothetical protein B0H14DRAFT_3451145 [Mycena olivaceomarginata]